MCVAPLNGKWYRAIALKHTRIGDEVLIQLVDYGGFAKMKREMLRFTIREDVMRLPFQAQECLMADIHPFLGATWTKSTRNWFQRACLNKIIKAKLIGHHRDSGLPYIRLFIKNNKDQVWLLLFLLSYLSFFLVDVFQ